MSALPAIDFGSRMSSRQIAEIVGSRHDNVLRAIRSLAEKGLLQSEETPYVDPQNGQIYREFVLGFRDTMLVASGYRAELRAAIIDRWIELEQAARRQAPDYVTRAEFEALRAEVMANRAPKIASTLPDRMRNFIRERGAVKKHVLLKRFPDINASQRDGVLNRLCVEGHVQIILVSPPRSGRPASVCRWVQ